MQYINASHLIFLVNPPDDFINHELLFQELLVSLLFLALVVQELLLQFSLVLRHLLLVVPIHLLLLTCCLLFFAAPLAGKVFLLALVKGSTVEQGKGKAQLKVQTGGISSCLT